MVFITSLIVYLIILGLVYWLVSLLPLPEPFGNIINVLFIILVILLLVYALLGVPGVVPRLR